MKAGSLTWDAASSIASATSSTASHSPRTIAELRLRQQDTHTHTGRPSARWCSGASPRVVALHITAQSGAPCDSSSTYFCEDPASGGAGAREARTGLRLDRPSPVTHPARRKRSAACSRCCSPRRWLSMLPRRLRRASPTSLRPTRAERRSSGTTRGMRPAPEHRLVRCAGSTPPHNMRHRKPTHLPHFHRWVPLPARGGRDCDGHQ